MAAARKNIVNESFDGVITEMTLRQLGGAEIKKMHGLQYQISFPLNDDYKVRYVYTINNGGALFLQRLAPYPMRPARFASETELIEFIKTDYKKFQNAQNSSNFGKFIEAVNTVIDLTIEFEEVFLNYNVSADKIERFSTAMEETLGKVSNIKNKAKRIYFVEYPRP